MKIGNRYSFTTMAPSILGQDYSDMTLLAIGGYALASRLENVDVILNNIYPYLGSNAPSDATKDEYYVFTTAAGGTKVFGSTWINQATIDVTGSQSITVVVDNVSASDVSKIRELLASAGYNAITTRIS